MWEIIIIKRCTDISVTSSLKEPVFQSKCFVGKHTAIQFHPNLLDNLKGVVEVSRVAKVECIHQSKQHSNSYCYIIKIFQHLDAFKNDANVLYFITWSMFFDNIDPNSGVFNGLIDGVAIQALYKTDKKVSKPRLPKSKLFTRLHQENDKHKTVTLDRSR